MEAPETVQRGLWGVTRLVCLLYSFSSRRRPRHNVMGGALAGGAYVTGAMWLSRQVPGFARGRLS
jgi:hypothetical protein